ncbi:CAP domain-containing protein [Hydrogenimonas sp.]
MRPLVLFLLILVGGWWACRNHFVAAGSSIPPQPIVEEGAGDPVIEGMEARLYLNGLREAAGLPPFYWSATLGGAAAGHASYLAQNRVDGHGQTPSLPGYTGAGPVDRAVAAGYPSRMVQENLSSGNSGAKDSVDGLFSAIYHRFGFLDPVMDEIGIAYAKEASGRRIYVYDMGNYRMAGLCSGESFVGAGRYVTGLCADEQKRVGVVKFERVLRMNKERSKKVILWPYEGQEDVPPAFFEESPDPLPGFSVSGYPISILFNDRFFKRVTLEAFRLYETSGKKEIPVRLMNSRNDPNLLLKKNQFAIFPLERLEYATRYTARADYIADGKRGAEEWHFTTRRLEMPLLKVGGNEAVFEIEPRKRYALYLQPHGPNDLPKEVIHPRGMVVERIDPNTFGVEITERKLFPVTIEAGGRTIRLEAASPR